MQSPTPSPMTEGSGLTERLSELSDEDSLE